MNRKGFTLTELLATLVVLGIIMGIALVSTMGGFGSAKKRTENVFVSTIEDALDMYLDSDARNLDFSTYVCEISKTNGKVKLYKGNDITFRNIINSKYSPLMESDLVNPANEKVDCNTNVSVTIYRDEDYVYYYKIRKSDFGCLLDNDRYITNLSDGDLEC